MARWRDLSWLVTPVGQWPVWHGCAWMQPTANMKPRAALHQSAPERHDARHVEAGDDLAGGAELDAVAQIGADEGRMHEGEAVAQRHAEVIHEFERGRAGAAFVAVDDDEIRGDAGLEHGLDDRQELPGMADAQLEAGGFAARQAAHLGDELQQPDWRRERRVAAGEMQSSPMAARRGCARFLRVTLAPEHAAMAGLGTLAQLQLDHLDLRVGRDLGELLG